MGTKVKVLSLLVLCLAFKSAESAEDESPRFIVIGKHVIKDNYVKYNISIVQDLFSNSCFIRYATGAPGVGMIAVNKSVCGLVDE